MKLYREITPLQQKEVFGIFDYPDASFDYPLHSHPEYEINLVRNGAGNRIVGDKVEKYRDTDLVLLGPNLSHSWDNADIDKNTCPHTAVIFIQFEEHLLDNLLTKEDFYPIKVMLQYAHRGIEFLGETKAIAIDKMQALHKLSGFDATIAFFQFLHFLSHSKDKRLIASPGYSSQITLKQSIRLDEVYLFIQENFHRPISLEEVAQVANMSTSAFSHYFKRSTNRNFSAFLRDIRLGHASRLLTTTQLNISEIAFQCGYSNLSNFNRLFKKYKEMTPFAYRKQVDYTIKDFEERFVEE